MPSGDEIRSILDSEELLGRLASAEHERWAHWQRYVHDRGERLADGSLLIPAELVARWDAQISTPYSDLDAEQQQSDKDQVRRYLPIILEALTR